MTLRHITRFAVLALGGLAAACASPSPPPGPVSSGFAGGSAARSESAPVRMADQNAGYQINGEIFSGDLVFEQSGDRPVVTYRHSVDGAPLVVAELDLADSWLADGVRRFEGRSDRGVAIEVELVSGPCRVAGRMHARFARVTAGRTAYQGCARETGPVTRWSEALPRYLGAVQACEADAAASSMTFVRRGVAHVIHARVEDQARVLRYRFGQGGRWDCAVTGERVRWSVVPERAGRLAGEGDPVFAPGRMPPAGEGCYLYERVQTPAGDMLGALGEDVCGGAVGLAPQSAPFG